MPIAYQLRIQLSDLKPATYRDVLLDPATTLSRLHRVIQAAMGWEDAHMHGFAAPLKNEAYWAIPPDRRYEPPQPDDWGEPAQDEARFKLSDLLREPKSKLLYMYDFGDDWEHTVTLSAVVDTELPLPHLLKAQSGCPPEDCGGPHGAAHWAAIWHDDKHPEHEVARDMFGNREPGWLNFEALQRAVRKLQPRGKTASAKRTPKAD